MKSEIFFCILDARGDLHTTHIYKFIFAQVYQLFTGITMDTDIYFAKYAYGVMTKSVLSYDYDNPESSYTDIQNHLKSMYGSCEETIHKLEMYQNEIRYVLFFETEDLYFSFEKAKDGYLLQASPDKDEVMSKFIGRPRLELKKESEKAISQTVEKFIQETVQLDPILIQGKPCRIL